MQFLGKLENVRKHTSHINTKHTNLKLQCELYLRWAFSGLLTDGGGSRKPPLPEFCHTSYSVETSHSHNAPKGDPNNI